MGSTLKIDERWSVELKIKSTGLCLIQHVFTNDNKMSCLLHQKEQKTIRVTQRKIFFYFSEEVTTHCHISKQL